MKLFIILYSNLIYNILNRFSTVIKYKEKKFQKKKKKTL